MLSQNSISFSLFFAKLYKSIWLSIASNLHQTHDSKTFFIQFFSSNNEPTNEQAKLFNVDTESKKCFTKKLFLPISFAI